MSFIIIAFKIIIVLSYGHIVFKLYKAKSKDNSIKFEFDLLSSLELCVSTALSLISLLSVIKPSTYVFTIVICIIAVILVVCQSFRIILVGNNYSFIRCKLVNNKHIVKLSAEKMFFLSIKTKSNEQLIYVPLTSNNRLKKLIK